MVHGDDFVAAGDPDHLESAKMVLGSAATDAKEVSTLNKMVRMTDAGIEPEADPRHAELVVRELGLGKCRTS